jgi:DNA mismatch repair protein MutL
VPAPAPITREKPQTDSKVAEFAEPLPNVNSAESLYAKRDVAADSAAAVMDTAPGFEKVLDAIIESEKEAPPRPEQTEISEIRGLAGYHIIGQLFDTYLLCECGDALYLIDQHAAHERLNYEDYKKRAGQGTAPSQRLLVPAVRKFSQADFTLIGEYMDVFTDLGFEIEEFGELTYRFSALPLAVQKGNVDSMIDEAVYEIRNNRHDVVLARDKVISAACRHSVKAGNKLADSEITRLIKEITEMESLPTCPHGRPVAICLTKSDLKKGFKRTV